MLLFSIESTGGYSPNAGHQPRLVNQVGQDNFKLDAYLTAKNTGEDYSGTWQVTQTLLDDAGGVHSTVVKEGAVAVIPKGSTVELSPMVIGSLPMKGVDTMGKTYGLRVTVKDATGVLSDQVTPLRFQETDTYFDGATVKFGGGGVATDATPAITAEIARNEKEIVALPPEIKARQERLAKLTARNEALKAVPGVAA